MDALSQDDARAEAAVWQALVLYSTLSTAADVWQEASERRAGRDPSDQEAEAVVRPYLRQAAGTVQARLMHLHAARLRTQEAGPVAALVRRYHALMALRRVVHEMRVIHRRLLSLYPAVTEQLVEEIRLLVGEGERLLDDPAADDEPFFIRQGLVFTGHLLRELG